MINNTVITLIVAVELFLCSIILEQSYSQGKLIVSSEEIALLDTLGNVLDRFEFKSEVIFGCSVDYKERYLFCILGIPGMKRGERIAVYSWADDKIRNIFCGEARYNPWKILLADVDGDSAIDVCVGVWKKTRYDPVDDNRLFVYGWEDERLFPKWLGSRLSAPFLDLEFADIDGDGNVELIALELQRNRLKRLMSYKWQSFGFVAFKIILENRIEESLKEFNFQKELLK